MAIELKPIRSATDYEAALSEIERLWSAKSGTPKGDRLDVLATLIDAYDNEAAHFPFDRPDPIDAIKFRMEQMGLTRKDLEPLIGSRARVAEVLNRKRSLSIDMIRRLNDRLGARQSGLGGASSMVRLVLPSPSSARSVQSCQVVR